MNPNAINEIRALIQEIEHVEMVYVHDESGKPILAVVPLDGWWASQWPEAPEDHFGHEHVYPWGGDE